MANNGVITIKFVDGTKPVPGPEPINDKQEKQEQEVGILETALTSALVHRTFNQVKNFLVNETKYQLDMYYRMNDNYLGQQSMNVALSVINKVVSVGTSVYAGAKLGAKMAGGSAWGAVGGAILAGTVSLGSIVLDIGKNYVNETIRLNQMDRELQFNRRRAGYSLTAGSIGEGF